MCFKRARSTWLNTSVPDHCVVLKTIFRTLICAPVKVSLVPFPISSMFHRMRWTPRRTLMVSKKMKTGTKMTGKNGKTRSSSNGWKWMAGMMRMSGTRMIQSGKKQRKSSKPEILTSWKTKLKMKMIKMKVLVECSRVLIHRPIRYTMIRQRHEILNNREAKLRLPKKTYSSLRTRKSSSPRDMSIWVRKRRQKASHSDSLSLKCKMKRWNSQTWMATTTSTRTHQVSRD